MGNPHVILCCDNDPWKVKLEVIGPLIENDPWFPKRVNVHFVKFESCRKQAIVRTWERGSGITLACGSGASAVCVAGVLLDLCDRQLLTKLPGGDLEIDCASNDSHVIMTGPATEVFQGTVNLK